MGVNVEKRDVADAVERVVCVYACRWENICLFKTQPCLCQQMIRDMVSAMGSLGDIETTQPEDAEVMRLALPTTVQDDCFRLGPSCNAQTDWDKRSAGVVVVVKRKRWEVNSVRDSQIAAKLNISES